MWNQCSHAKTNAIFDRERKKETPTTTTGETNIIKNKNRNRFNENLAISYHVFKSYTIWLTALAGCLIETVKEWFVFYFCFSSFAFQAILLHSFRCCSGSRKCFLLLLLLFSSWMSKLCEHFFFRTPYLWIDNVECEIKKNHRKIVLSIDDEQACMWQYLLCKRQPPALFHEYFFIKKYRKHQQQQEQQQQMKKVRPGSLWCLFVVILTFKICVCWLLIAFLSSFASFALTGNQGLSFDTKIRFIRDRDPKLNLHFRKGKENEEFFFSLKWKTQMPTLSLYLPFWQ